MRTWKWQSKVGLALLVLAFAYFIFPTPWRHFTVRSVQWRENRVTGRAERFDTSSGKWKPKQQSPPMTEAEMERMLNDVDQEIAKERGGH